MTPKTSAPQAAAIYARISDDPHGTQLGVERQLKECRELAARRGWPVGQLYIDNDVSAWSGKVRPQYKRMLADIEAGAVDGVIAWALDRLHRQPKELEAFFEVCDRARLRYMATVSGDIDLSTRDGQFHARIMGAVAKKSSDDSSARLKSKARETAENGEFHGGQRPYGFTKDGATHNPEEAARLLEAKDRIIAGETLHSICRDFRKRGVKSARGGPWRTLSLRRALTSERVAGYRLFNGEVIGRANWEPIINDDDWRRLRSILLDPTRRLNGHARSYLLSGMLYCGKCGYKLRSRPRGDGARRYSCAGGTDFDGCGKIGVLADAVEPFVVQAVLTALDSPDFLKRLRQRPEQADVNGIMSQIERAQFSLDELAAGYARHEISYREWMAARQPLQAGLETLQAQARHIEHAATVQDIGGDAKQLGRHWDALPFDRRRAVLSAVTERIVVGPAVKGRNYFDPSRVAITWRV